MSRRSAVATETGTTGATLALADPGLGSPLQPDPRSPNKKISAIKQFESNLGCPTGLIDGCRTVEL
jgi:hypothetical protein